MWTELILFGATTFVLLLGQGNLAEWWKNLQSGWRENWRHKWYKIPTTKIAFSLFLIVSVIALAMLIIRFPIYVFTIDIFVIARYLVFFFSGASLWLFLYCLGGRPRRVGTDVGRLNRVEGTPSGHIRGQKEKSPESGWGGATEDVLTGFIDSALYSEKKSKKKDEERR